MRRTRGAEVVAVFVTLGVTTALFVGFASRARAQDEQEGEAGFVLPSEPEEPWGPAPEPPPATAPSESRTAEPHASRATGPGPRRAPTPDELEHAGVLFERSVLAYDERRFDAAIALLVEAYALSHEPILVYNLARAQEGAGELEEALASYRRYLELAPEAENAHVAQRRMTRLEEQLAERERARALEQEREAERERLAREEAERAAAAALEAERRAREEARRRSAAPSPWPWVVAGAGGAGALVGAILGGVALDVHSRATRAETQVEARARDDEAQTLATGANVALVAGTVLVGVGVAWGVIELIDQPSDGARVDLAVGPGTVGLRGTF